MQVIIKQSGKATSYAIKGVDQCVIIRGDDEVVTTAITPEAVDDAVIESLDKTGKGFLPGEISEEYEKMPTIKGLCERSFYLFGCRQDLEGGE